MKNITLAVIFLGIGTFPITTNADTAVPADHNKTAVVSSSPNNNGAERAETQGKETSSGLAKDAGERGTPPWTNDSANINLQQPRTPPDKNLPEPYTAQDFEVKPEWDKLFADHSRFSTESGEELYHTMCQACHMEDGQGASEAGDYPSFVGDERLRSPFYPIDVVLNGFRGMPGFRDQLSDQQIADVVNYLRTSFGNQLESDVTPEDVVRVRH
ncbi:c-type cytochrome [Halomonas halodenitrificans]|uniref:c-type cytochrome n=1 Tax=Halomonas halodenitrificans TaxID=28252 RepID=UPI000685AEB5|nr:cytochrome c [Halomonas halodenitrificans]